MKKDLHKRYWLNPVNHDDTGHVKISSTMNSYDAKEKEKISYLDLSFEISDCTRKISLNFDLFNDKNPNERRKEYRSRKRKVQILRDCLDIIDERLDTFIVCVEKQNQK